MLRVGSFKRYIAVLVLGCLFTVFVWSTFGGLHKSDGLVPPAPPCPPPPVSQSLYDSALKKQKVLEELLEKCTKLESTPPPTKPAPSPSPSPTPPPTPSPTPSPTKTAPPPSKSADHQDEVEAVDLETCYAPLKERKSPVHVPEGKSVVHVVSHSHWDREWYLPLEQYRRRLVHSLDNMLKTFYDPQKNFVHYHSDGQSVMLEDYLRVRPQNRLKIMQSVAEDRLSAGPWYTQPDEFLASGEALIRNIMIGMRTACEYGAVPMQVAYMPDTFGHSGQLPQIFNGFDIHDCVLARGIDPPPKSELMWDGVDGSKLFCVYLSKWYCNAKDIGAEGGSLISKLWHDIRGYSSTRHSLLMNGCDQTGFDERIPDVVKDASQNLAGEGAVVIQSSIETYVRTVKKEVSGNPSHHIGPELRTGDDVNVGLVNVLSNKMSQKKANWLVQNIMEKWAEPFSAIADLVDNKHKKFDFAYDSDAITLAWKFIVKNHAHDSIYGCSASEVHDDVDNRFQRARQVGETLASEALAVLVQYVKSPDAANPTVVVYNPSNVPQTNQLVFAEVDVDGWEAAKVLDSNNSEVPSITLERSSSSVFDYMLPETGLREAHRVSRRLVVGWLATVEDGVGYATYHLASSTSPAPTEKEVTLENKYIKAEVHPEGTITITNLESGITVGPLNKLEDVDDQGHSYMAKLGAVHSADSSKVTVHKVRETSVGSFCEVEVRFYDDMKVRVVYVLTAESKRVDVIVTYNNQHPNHLLRTLITSSPRGVSVDCPFEVIDRGHQGFAPVNNFISTSVSGGALTVGTRGITEYQYANGLYLSLTRSTREMGDWGEFETPSGQDFGEHFIEYSLIVTKDALEGHQEARIFSNPMSALQVKRYPRQGPYSNSLVSISRKTELRVLNQWLTKQTFFPSFNTHANWRPANYWSSPPLGLLPAKHTFITVEPHDRLVLSAVKRAEDRPGLLVRFYNPYGDETTATVTVDLNVGAAKEAHICKLNEVRQEALTVKNNTITTKVGLKKVVTVEFVF